MSHIELRPYQIQGIDDVRDAFRQGHSDVLLVISTGGGKTTIASKMIKATVDKGGRCIFIAHRNELVDQAAARLRKFDINPSVIKKGRMALRQRPVSVASVPTLTRRIDQRPKANLLIVDEAHHSTSPSFRRLIDAYKADGAKVVGLTATPYRTDDTPLGDIYSAIIAPTSLRELTELGFLVPARYYGPRMSREGMKMRGKEFDPTAMFDKYNKRELYDEVVAQYQRFAQGTKAIVFCINVQHSRETVAAFCQAGYPAAHIDGETPDSERSRTLAAFARGDVQILSNVGLFTEGYDLPDIETVILNRMTKSRGLYMQIIGRGLRPAPNKRWCTVIDMGNNVRFFGPVEEEPEPSLKPKKKDKKQGVAPVKDCPSCTAIVHPSALVCPQCQYLFEQEKKQLKKAEFEEINAAELLAAKRKETPDHLRKPFSAMSVAELNELAEIRGYKLGWIIRQLRDSHRGKLEGALAELAELRGYKPGWVARQLLIHRPQVVPSQDFDDLGF